jgi:hypothetical protein
MWAPIIDTGNASMGQVFVPVGMRPAPMSHDPAEFENTKSRRNRRHRILYLALGGILAASDFGAD